jgi:hypothetical protein
MISRASGIRVILIIVTLWTPVRAIADNPSACPRIQLILDPHLDEKKIQQAWGSGQDRKEGAAILALKDCSGSTIDRLVLPGPLARLDPKPLAGVTIPTYLVTVDVTAEAGSYNGPLTQVVEIRSDKLSFVSARDMNGKLSLIRLASTLKQSWKRSPSGQRDDILSVRCEPLDDHFVTRYRRYQASPDGWRLFERITNGLWEADGAFPERSLFP